MTSASGKVTADAAQGKIAFSMLLVQMRIWVLCTTANKAVKLLANIWNTLILCSHMTDQNYIQSYLPCAKASSHCGKVTRNLNVFAKTLSLVSSFS